MKKLQDFGTDLSSLARQGRLPRGHHLDGICSTVTKALLAPPRRSVALVGPPGAGKTAIVQELTHRLLAAPEGPWHVQRVSASDIMKGTRYLGDYETRVGKLIDAARGQKIILYVPGLDELCDAGRSASSLNSVATALAPYIDDGSVTLLGETTSELFERHLGRHGSFKRLFDVVEVPEADRARTLGILKEVAAEVGQDVSLELLARIFELSEYYQAGTGQPGKAVGLLRADLESLHERSEPVSLRGVLMTLSRSTGVPVDLLDDSRDLDLRQLRTFFESRVMGQPEAVSAVVDLVAMVKAGLTDPEKPFGVLLFLGPTGVGKTELARALAESIFGDARRLLRFDMSEYNSYDAHEWLIGIGDTRGTLTSALQAVPFSVVLLDEIEKAHPNVFDICLQLFDAGRLTDGTGQTVDCRKTIVVLTSNAGVSYSDDEPIGFGTQPTRGKESPLKALTEWFRPELLNRIDRIIQFRPLTLDVAERIARREIHRVLERGGITRRGLSIDVPPEVISHLLREGYSPMLGARELKRTVERRVLLPLARHIASGRVREETMLQLKPPDADGGLRVAVLPSPGTDAGSPPGAVEVAAVRENLQSLRDHVEELRRLAAPLTERKSQLLRDSTATAFWNHPPTARRTLDEIHRLDGLLANLSRVEAATLTLVERLERPRILRGDVTAIAEHIESLRHDAEQLSILVSCREPRDLGDALLFLSLASSRRDETGSVELLARLYQGLARNRRLDFEVVGERQAAASSEDAMVLYVGGAGAYAQLKGERGLHEFVVRSARQEGDERKAERQIVRVEAVPIPIDAAQFREGEIETTVTRLEPAHGRLLSKLQYAVEVFHAPTLTAVRFSMRGPREDALRKCRILLWAKVEAQRSDDATAASATLVRRYTLGANAKVRDFRTGRSTTRVKRVLRGHLEVLSASSSSGSRGGDLLS